VVMVNPQAWNISGEAACRGDLCMALQVLFSCTNVQNCIFYNMRQKSFRKASSFHDVILFIGMLVYV
jgi:hypothetical protein